MAFLRRTNGFRKIIPRKRQKRRNRIDNTKNTLYNEEYRAEHKIELIGADIMNTFKQQLFELLSIQATSGNEKKVVDYTKPILEKLCETVFLDSYGNLLAEKKIGTGEGATIVLSAHMDTVSDIQAGRKVLFNKDTQTFTSSKGVLGADDRAGMAIILAVLRNIDKTEFNGTIKVCFSREEEIGCVGADEIPVDFYKDANLAIVVDRRGHRDIVTGCGVMYGFCSEAVGKFFEDVSGLLDMEWKAVPGGVSDAMSFSANGIHSVNLSAGYMNEHTSKESVNIVHCRDTINLILQAFSVVNTQYHKFGAVPEKRKWESSYVSNYYPRRRGLSATDLYWAQEDYAERGEMTFYDEPDTFGGVIGSTTAGYVSLFQGKLTDRTKAHEVFMDETAFRRLVDQYCIVTGYAVGTQLKNDAEKARLDSDFKSLVSEFDTKHGNGSNRHYTVDANNELVLL